MIVQARTLALATALTSALAATACASAGQGRQAPPYIDNRSTPADLVRSLYSAVNLHQYARAWAYFGRAKPVGSYRAFRKGYAGTAHVSLKLGHVRSEGAAGSIYSTVPVAIRAADTSGPRRVYAGCYLTHLIQPGIQEPPFRPLFIEKAHLVPRDRPLAAALPESCKDDATPVFARTSD